MNFDRLTLRSGASEMLRMAEMPTAEVLIAKIVFWIVWLGFIVSAVDTLQLTPFQGLVEEFFRFVPRFLVALLVLVVGFLVGNFLWRATLLASVNAGLPGARLLSGALRVLVIAIGVVMALEQVGLATSVDPGGVCDHVWRADARARDRVRTGWTRGRESAHRGAAQGQAGTRIGRRASSVDHGVSPFKWRAPPSDVAAGWLRDWRPRPGGRSNSSISSRRAASDSGRCCRSDRPATAIRRISASPRLPAIRCWSALTV